MKDPTKLFWTEGSIDAIALDGLDAPIRFRLVPSAAFTVETDSGKWMLFKEAPPQRENAHSTMLEAKLVACQKKQDGKDGIWFQWDAWTLELPKTTTGSGEGEGKVQYATPPFFKLLLEAKNARCILRPGIEAGVLETDSIGAQNTPLGVSSLVVV